MARARLTFSPGRGILALRLENHCGLVVEAQRIQHPDEAQSAL